MYQRSIALADEVRYCLDQWPILDRRTAGEQTLRAADSVHANLAEAMGRYGDRDQRHFLHIARGSALELAGWLDTAERRGLDRPQNGPDRAREIARMLNGLIRRRTHRMSPP